MARSTAASSSGVVGASAGIFATARAVTGSERRSCRVSKATVPARTVLPRSTAGGAPSEGLAWLATTRPLEGSAGSGGTCSMRSSHSWVASGIWLKRKSRFSARKENSSSSVTPGSLACWLVHSGV